MGGDAALFQPKPRLDGWSKQTLLDEMESTDLSVSSICRKYTPPGVSWRTLQWEVIEWRDHDPDFKAEYQRLLKSRDPGGPGKPRREEVDPEFGDWKIKFVRDFLVLGSMEGAARLAPYSLMTIQRRLDPSHVSYDKDFAELMGAATTRVNTEMEDGIIRSFREAQNPRDRAWIAKIWLESKSKETWGKQVNLKHSGGIAHTHTHALGGKTREERLAELANDQAGFFGGAQQALPEPRQSVDLVLDAEYVETEGES